MRVRKPVPTRLKLMAGNPGKRPISHKSPSLLHLSICPPELGPVDRLVPELAELGLLTNLDRAALAAYCGAYALWAEAMAASRNTERWSNRHYPLRGFAFLKERADGVSDAFPSIHRAGFKQRHGVSLRN